MLAEIIYKYSSSQKQEQTRLSTGDTLFTVEGWKSNPKSRLYEMEKTAEALNEDMVYHISIYGSDTYKTAQQALQKPIAILREKALGRSGQITLADNKNRPRDVSAEETLRIYEEFYQMLPNRLVFCQHFPSLEGKSVLDLGCGYGWHCKFAEEQGATKILGIDLSKKMIEEAQKRNSGNQIEYRISGLEEYDYPENEWDCVISNLALHYIEDIVEIFQKCIGH